MPACPPAPLPGSPTVINTPSSWSPKTDKDNNAAFIDSNNNKINKNIGECHIVMVRSRANDKSTKFTVEVARNQTNTRNNSERPVDALAVKKVNHSVTDNLKSRETSASKNVAFVQ